MSSKNGEQGGQRRKGLWDPNDKKISRWYKWVKKMPDEARFQVEGLNKLLLQMANLEIMGGISKGSS